MADQIRRSPVLRTAIALAATVAAAGCGSEAPPARGDFGERIQSIDRRGSEQWARLAQHGASLEPGARLSPTVIRAIEEMVSFQRRATEELDGLAAPKGADDEVESLAQALHDLRGIFERAVDRGRFSRREFAGIEGAGEAVDKALEGLRRGGFVEAEETAESR